MWVLLKYAMVSAAVGIAAVSAGTIAWWIAGAATLTDAAQFGAGVGAAALSASLVTAAAFGFFHWSSRLEIARRAAPHTHSTLSESKSSTGRLFDSEVRENPSPSTSTVTPTRRPRKPMARVTKSLRWAGLTESAAGLLGQARTDLVGQSIFHRIHPQDITLLEGTIALARNSGSTKRCVCRFVPADKLAELGASDSENPLADTEILPLFAPEVCQYIHFTIRPRRDKSDLSVRLSDVTTICRPREVEALALRKELRVTQNQQLAATFDLERLKQSYRELYQNAPVMYFSVDQEGRLVTFNETLLRLLGYERKDLHNQFYTILLSPEARSTYVAISQNMPKQEGEIETRWSRKDGSTISVWVHTTPVYDDDGRFVRCRNAALDLTEKNRLANEAKLRGDQLEQTNQRLRGINNELEAFTHVVSHDLKEPLRTLQAYAHLLAEEHGARLGADGFQYVNHMVRASRRLGRLIDELLKLSQAGRITKERQTFNLLEVVATVRQDLVDLIQRKNAVVLTEGPMPNLFGDSARVTQLLANLVGNGLKYNKNAAPKIVIGSTGSESGTATLFVRDNGIGIAPAFHKQVFGIFRRLHNDEEYEGTGAGLAICKKIVEAHGGRIWIESTPGTGTVFFFTLPTASSENGSAAPNIPLQKEHALAAPRRSKLDIDHGNDGKPRIVLVDDQEDVGLIVRKLGKRDGLAIAWFPNAEDALAHLQTHRADLLLLDINLPGMNGVELCRRLRRLPHLAEASVAMFTPDHDDDSLHDLRAAGADFFLTKDLLCHPAKWQMKMQELLEQFRAAPVQSSR